MTMLRTPRGRRRRPHARLRGDDRPADGLERLHPPGRLRVGSGTDRVRDSHGGRPGRRPRGRSVPEPDAPDALRPRSRRTAVGRRLRREQRRHRRRLRRPPPRRRDDARPPDRPDRGRQRDHRHRQRHLRRARELRTPGRRRTALCERLGAGRGEGDQVPDRQRRRRPARRESVTVAVTVRNDAGWPGERDVRVTAADQSAADRNSADRTVAQQTVRLDAESERTVTATVTFDQPGTYRLGWPTATSRRGR